MMGAIIGDILGSPYEFCNTKNDFVPFKNSRPESVKDIFGWIYNHAPRCTDDTIMTLAVAKALLKTRGKDDQTIVEEVKYQMRRYYKKYPKFGYGKNFRKWAESPQADAYGSIGNGSAMRVSSVGWLYPTLEETLHIARLTAEVTHNSKSGVEGAQATAAAIYLARCIKNKKAIKEYLIKNFKLDISKSPEELETKKGFQNEMDCRKTVEFAFCAFLQSESYEEAIQKAVLMGGDTDTIACITGGIAEAYYGEIPHEWKERAWKILKKIGITEEDKEMLHKFQYCIAEQEISLL